MEKRIVIFASGSGTNSQTIIEYFQRGKFAKVVLVLSNKKGAKVLSRAESLNVAAASFSKSDLLSENGVLELLQNERPDLIVLAGFLLKFPGHILRAFPNKVVNIHPALLPKYGGKGMFGAHVHEAVVANKEKETGITIHFVNENYDEGQIIFQESVELSKSDTPEIVAKKVHQLEHTFFPQVIETLLLSEENLQMDQNEDDLG